MYSWCHRLTVYEFAYKSAHSSLRHRQPNSSDSINRSSLTAPPSSGNGSKRRIRRIRILLRPRDPPGRLLLRHSLRLSKARSEMAPGPMGEEPVLRRRSQSPVPENSGGLYSVVRSREEVNVRCWSPGSAG